MACVKCKKDLPSGAEYCPWCGKKQTAASYIRRRLKGSGCIYRRGNTYTAVMAIGKTIEEDGTERRITRSKGGFRTKKEADEWLRDTETQEQERREKTTLRQLYERWLPTHRAGKDTMNCYKAAYKHLRPIWDIPLWDLDIDDIQEVFDECGMGRRTQENMKTVVGLIFKYGIPRRCVRDNLNLAPFIIVGGARGPEKNAFTDAELELLQKNVGKIPYVDYIYAQCYLGFRPSELLQLDALKYDRKHRAFVGGIKTDAGKERTVTVSPKIRAIVDGLVKDKLSGPVFCNRETGGIMGIREYRERFYAALDALGIENPVGVDGRHRLTPHSCRHTFATLMKRVPGADKDKLALIGHTSDSMLRHYQDVSYADLERITDAI